MERINCNRSGWLCAFVALALVAFGAVRVVAAAEENAQAAASKEAAPHEGSKAEVSDKEVSPKSAEHAEAAGHGHKPSLEDLDNSHANATPELGKPEQLKSDLAIFTIVVFLLLLAILWKFAWGPIMEGLAKREQTIANQIAEANQAAADARAMLAEHQAKLSSAAAEVRQLLEEGRREAEASAAKIVSEANAAAKRERDTALSQIDAAKNAALRELAQKSVDTAISLAGKIVSTKLTPQDHAQLVREATAQLPSAN